MEGTFWRWSFPRRRAQMENFPRIRWHLVIYLGFNSTWKRFETGEGFSTRQKAWYPAMGNRSKIPEYYFCQTCHTRFMVISSPRRLVTNQSTATIRSNSFTRRETLGGKMTSFPHPLPPHPQGKRKSMRSRKEIRLDLISVTMAAILIIFFRYYLVIFLYYLIIDRAHCEMKQWTRNGRVEHCLVMA